MATSGAALIVQLELAGEADDGDDEALFTMFSRAIRAAIRTRRSDAPADDEVIALCDRVAALVEHGRAAVSLCLVDVLCARLHAADGGEALWSRVGAVHLAACRELVLDPAVLAAALFTRWVERGWPCFAAAGTTHADLLGANGLAIYRRAAEAAWATLPALRSGDRRLDDDDAGLRTRLAALLDGFAAADGDLDARIAIRAKCLDSAPAYRAVAELCLGAGRAAEALRWAEEGQWQFEDDPDPGLDALVLRLRASRRGSAGTPSKAMRRRR
jgi:hypothetical protein